MFLKVQELLKYALHLRQNGENAPGGNETWEEFDKRAEKFLRGQQCHSYDKPVISSIEYLENEKGAVEISFCMGCGEVLRVICEHKKNTWKGPEGGRKLTCDLCGADGT